MSNATEITTKIVQNQIIILLTKDLIEILGFLILIKIYFYLGTA